MNCNLEIERLSSFVDDELSQTDDNEVRVHIEQCPTCRERIETLRRVKHGLSQIPGRREPTEALRARVEKLHFQSRSSRRRRTLQSLAVAALLLVTAFTAFLATPLWEKHSDDGTDWAKILVDDHLQSVPAAKPADVTSNDPVEVQDFFANKLPFVPIVPELPQSHLIGGRLCTFADEPVQLLFYEYKDKVVSLFVTDSAVLSEGCTESGGHSICVRDRDGMRLMLVGDASSDWMKEVLATL